MSWAAIVGKITGTVDKHLVHRNGYLLAENRILCSSVKNRMSRTDSERISLAKAAKPIERGLLAEIATIVKPDTLLRWRRRLVESRTLQSSNAISIGPGHPTPTPMSALASYSATSRSRDGVLFDFQ